MVKTKDQKELREEKPPTDCTEHPRMIVLARNQSNPTNQPLKPIKDPGKKSPIKQNEHPRKIKLNLTPNRFEGLEVMDIAEKQSETNKLTKQKKTKRKPYQPWVENNEVELSRIKSKYQ